MQNRQVVSVDLLKPGQMFYDIYDNICVLCEGKPEKSSIHYVELRTGAIRWAPEEMKVKFCSISFG